MTIIDGEASVELTPDAKWCGGAAEREQWNLRGRLLGGDVAAATMAWGGALWLAERPANRLVVDLALLGLAVAATYLALVWQHLYRARVASNRSDEIARIARAVFAVAVAGVLGDQALGLPIFTPAVAGGGVAAFLAITYQRGRFRQWVRRARAGGHCQRPVLVVGGTTESAALIQTLNDWPELGFAPVAYAGPVEPGAVSPVVPWVGGTDDIVETVRSSGANGVVIAASSIPSLELNRMVRDLHQHGVHVHLSSGITGMHHRRLRIQPIGYEPLIYVEPASLSSLQWIVKRGLDVSASAVALVLSLPLLAVAALAVKLGDGGPVLFRQERVGRHGKPFTILKLRTMCVGAEDLLPELYEDNERDGPLFKLIDDPRVTRVGRILRATSTDELPQLLNVLGGSMSLVGPRPALPSEVGQFAHAAARDAVKPGITGLWQVEAREKASFAVYERLDMFYVENWSVWLDVAIILRTVRVVVSHARRASAVTHHPSSAPVRAQVGTG